MSIFADALRKELAPACYIKEFSQDGLSLLLSVLLDEVNPNLYLCLFEHFKPPEKSVSVWQYSLKDEEIKDHVFEYDIHNIIYKIGYNSDWY